MMPTAEDFLEIIRANPDDDVPKLVYADWLDEHGDRCGELIRLFVEVREDREKHKHWHLFVECVETCFHTSDFDDLINLLEERQQRLFACQCAESVLYLVDAVASKSDLPRKTIDIARQYANGQITKDTLNRTQWNVGQQYRFAEMLHSSGKWTAGSASVRSAANSISRTVNCVDADMDARVASKIAARFAAQCAAISAAEAKGWATVNKAVVLNTTEIYEYEGDYEVGKSLARNQQLIWLVERLLKFNID